jgi:hypothetical protein
MRDSGNIILQSNELERNLGKACVDEQFLDNWIANFDTVSQQLNIPSSEREIAHSALLEIQRLYRENEEIARARIDQEKEDIKLDAEIRRKLANKQAEAQTG